MSARHAAPTAAAADTPWKAMADQITALDHRDNLYDRAAGILLGFTAGLSVGIFAGMSLLMSWT